MKKSIIALGVSLLMTNSALAMPTGGNVISGTANLSGFSANPASGSTITVNGNVEISWDNFNIKSGEKLTFDIKKPGATVTICSKNGRDIVIGGSLNQAGLGRLHFNKWNVNILPSGSISANEFMIIGDNLTASGKINVSKKLEVYNKGNISGNNLDLTAGEIIFAANKKMSMINSNFKTTNKNISLVSQLPEKDRNDFIITSGENRLEISKCKIISNNEIYVHGYSVDINNNEMIAKDVVQFYAMTSHYWNANKNENVNKNTKFNTINLSNNIITTDKFMGINGGTSTLQGNKISAKYFTALSCNDFLNYSAKKVVSENISVLDKNNFTANSSVSIIGGPVSVDGKEYNKKGKYTHTGAGYNLAVNVLTDGVAALPNVSTAKKNETAVTTQTTQTATVTEIPISKENTVSSTASDKKEVTLESDGYYTMGDNPNDSVALAKTYAKNSAMRSIVEQTGVYIESYSEVKNAKLTMDEIKAISSNIIKIKECKYVTIPSGEAVTYKCHIVAEVNTDEIDLTVLLKNRDQKKLEDKIAELERRYAAMESKMNG